MPKLKPPPRSRWLRLVFATSYACSAGIAPLPSIQPTDSRGRLCHRTQRDGVGAVILNMLFAKALASQCGLQYIGSFPPRHQHLELARLIGLPEPLQELPAEAIRLARATHLTPEVESRGPWANATYYIHAIDLFLELDTSAKAVSTLFHPGFRLKLRRTIRPPTGTLWSQPTSSLRVAVHLRRGDAYQFPVGPGSVLRLQPNRYSLQILRCVRRIDPAAEFVIFSSSPFGDAQGFMSGDFQQLGAVLRLDGPLQEAWSHFAWAEVLVLSRSSFSFVPALFARGVVVFDEFWHHPLVHWLNGSLATSETFIFTEMLRLRLVELRMSGAIGGAA
mmetsp:Transcript_21112/g.59018  ORF Transcript_21112/g.59018 Transcript_21112/m.59018 type:complete len:333 (-) Transcript_21112:40-1038(-)